MHMFDNKNEQLLKKLLDKADKSNPESLLAIADQAGLTELPEESFKDILEVYKNEIDRETIQKMRKAHFAALTRIPEHRKLP